MAAMQQRLYEIKVGDTYRSRFAYAFGYTPLPDRKSFVPPAMQERNRQSIELNGFKPGIQISREGSKWPDFLFCGGGYVSFFVSERVVADLRLVDIEILDATEFPVESIEGRRTKLRIEDAPRYFVLEAPAEIEPNWAAMNVPTSPDGKPIHPIPVRSGLLPFLHRTDTWSGRDLVAMVGITTQLYGSERLKLYAAEKKWTNVEFDSIGMHSVQPRASLNCARS
jgi:hypothetical protein